MVLFILLNILLNSTHLRFLFICFKINVSTLLVVIFQLTQLLLICFFINVKSTEELYSRHQKVDKTADIETASRALNFLLFHQFTHPIYTYSVLLPQHLLLQIYVKLLEVETKIIKIFLLLKFIPNILECFLILLSLWWFNITDVF